MSNAPEATKGQKRAAIATLVVLSGALVYAMNSEAFRLLLSVDWPKLVIGTAAGILSGLGFGYGHAVYDVLLRDPWRNLLSKWTRKGS